MLVAIGPGVTSLADYTNHTNAEGITIKAAQGDALDELTCVVHDPNSSWPISNEDDIVILDEMDPNGWPTINLLQNPSYEGTYSGSGVAPSWSGASITGLTYSKNTGTVKYGSASQQVSISNVPGASTWWVVQNVAFPKDENGNIMNKTPIMASTWYNTTSSFSGVSSIAFGIEWWTAGYGSQISSSRATIPTGNSSNWRRVSVSATPPVGAGAMKVSTFFIANTSTIANPTVAPSLATATTGGTMAAGTYTLGYTWVGGNGETLLSPTAQITTTGTTSTITMTVPALPTGATGWNFYISAVGTTTPLFKQNSSVLTGTNASRTAPPVTNLGQPPVSNTAVTNSGTIILDATQLEYMTFANVNIPADYSTSLANPTMSGTVGSNTMPSWLKDNTAANIAYTVVSSPAIYATAEQVVLTGNAATSTTCGIKQSIQTKFNVAGNYTVTMQYQITSALNSATQIHFGVNWHDFSGSFVSNFAYAGPLGEGLSENWQTVSVDLGPNSIHPPPATASYIEIFAGIYNPGGLGGGTIVIGAITVTPWPSNRLYTTAGSTTYAGDGKYPTPFCDSTQPGCYVDSGYSGLPYRQLRIFGGYVRHAKYDYSASRERWTEIDAVDYGVLLAEAPATLLIRQQNDSSAIAQACQYAQNLGFLIGLDYTTYVTTIAAVDSMVFNWQTTRDVLSKIANLTIASYYVDYYKRLHYQPALANSAPFGVSDTPNTGANPPTYPMSGMSIDNDSSQLLNSPVIEGSTQLSTPQTFTQTCNQTTLSVALTNGATVSTITVAAITNAIPAGTYLTLSNSGHTQQIYVEATANAGATSINVSSGPGATTFQANFSYPITTTTVFTSGVTVNGGSAITQVDSLTIGGTARTVGLASVNQFSQGYDTLADPGPGTIYFNTPVFPANNGVVNVTYRFSFPVLVRITNPNSTVFGRKVHQHTKHDEISSKQSAIDRANADLAQYQKAQAIGELIITSPPVPRGLTLNAGMAIPITHAGAGYNQTLFQIQQIETSFGGNGFMLRKLTLGFYRPDFMIHLHQTRRAVFSTVSDAANDSILQDVVSVADQWAITDSLSSTVTNNGKWGGVTTSNWDGTNVWG